MGTAVGSEKRSAGSTRVGTISEVPARSVGNGWWYPLARSCRITRGAVSRGIVVPLGGKRALSISQALKSGLWVARIGIYAATAFAWCGFCLRIDNLGLCGGAFVLTPLVRCHSRVIVITAAHEKRHSSIMRIEWKDSQRYVGVA